MDHANVYPSGSSSESHDANSSASIHPVLTDRERERSRLMTPTTPSTVTLERPMPPFMSSSSHSPGSGGTGGRDGGPYLNLSGSSGSTVASGPPSPVTAHAPLPSDHQKLTSENSSVSLSVNYLPKKFSSTMLNPVGAGARRRKGLGTKKGVGGPQIPKLGGGVEAFRSGEARMPEDGDDDYDGVNLKSGSWFAAAQAGARKMRWNRFKWTLLLANIALSAYSLVGLVFCLCTWFDVWTHADIVRLSNHTELVISTLAASLGIITSMIGWAGILLNNRSFLAVYTLSLWITFVFLVAPGYLTYKRHTFNLEGKINAQWSRDLGAEGRLRIQDQLKCCGYFSPFIEATVSQTCYSRSVLPGCKLRYMQFERMVLRRWYAIVFALVPLHILITVAGLLCSNHVTYRFGKGMMPKAYRLSLNSMAVIMDQYANRLAEQYGSDVASDVLARSRSNLQLDALPSVGYAPSKPQTKYDSVNTQHST